MKIADLKNKKILIVGRGKEGTDALRFLKQKLPDAVIKNVDQTDGLNYLAHQADFDIAIKSPGIKKELLQIPYTSATNLFFGEVRGVTIGVTGTKGKSTTASLIAAVLQKAGKKAYLVGNIGTPMLGQLLVSNSPDDYFVCELSSYQLADIDASPHISVMINLYPEHMDYHGSVDAYWQAKKNIVKFVSEKDFLIYNDRFSELQKLAQETKIQTIAFPHEMPFSLQTQLLVGKHNYDNMCAAFTVCDLLKVPHAIIKAAFESFQPLPHRLEKIGTYKGIIFYDDAISTTPESTIVALETLDNVATLFLGGQDRGYDFSALAKTISEKKIKNIVLFPDSGANIKKAFDAFPKAQLNILETESMHDAVAFAFKNTPQGAICLLSSASPSYSLWKNFEEKGDEFQRAVKEFNSN
ncbi:UDP-N-acetylmuramoyl-L-alanine--D-glutamate ligase [Candidatus Microgenomates bacterium]|nr:MAG: UDP-N-acetylmuramoyl-L-alanine--D-glutamate ligase [Candidatus Microgenomates bacterium]